MKNLLFALVFITGIFISGCEKDTPNQENHELTGEILINKIIKELSKADSIISFKKNLEELTLSNQDVNGGITLFIPLDYIIDMGDYNAPLLIKFSESETKNHIVKGLHNRNSLYDGKKLTAISGKELEITKSGNITQINNIAFSGREINIGQNVVVHFIFRAIDYKYPDENEIEPNPWMPNEEEFLIVFSDLEAKVNDFHNLIWVTDALLSGESKVDSMGRIGYSSLRDLDRYGFTPSSNGVLTIWDRGWKAITVLNSIIKNTPSSINNKEERIAMMRTMRAYVYMQMQAYFGNIPVVPEVIDINTPISNNNRQQVIDYIETDLTEAEKVLTAETPYINNYTVKALLAKMALREKNYSKAKLYTEEIINSGKYTLEPRSSVFEPQSREIIWNNRKPLDGLLKVFFHNRAANSYIRLSEIYLMNAEANIRLGNIEKASTVLKPVFQRHGISESVDMESLIELWLKEMNREGTSFTNLVRWGVASEKLKSLGFEYPKNNVLPIPAKELAINRYLIQNPEYPK